MPRGVRHIQRPREGQGQNKSPANRMNAQTTIESPAASGDQDDPGSCSNAHAAPGDDGEGESASPGENREHANDTNCSTSAIEVFDTRAPATPAVDTHRITDLLKQAATYISRSLERVTVQLVDDAAMTVLHRDHCDIDGTTDVLTFDASESDDSPIEVDIAICIDEAARQAAQRDHSLGDEVLLYALHGIMHCLGYDDHNERDYRAMHAEEDRLLTLIGVGAVFNTSLDEGESQECSE